MMYQANADHNSAKFMAGYRSAQSLLCHRVPCALVNANTAHEPREYERYFRGCAEDEDTRRVAELATQHDLDYALSTAASP